MSHIKQRYISRQSGVGRRIVSSGRLRLEPLHSSADAFNCADFRLPPKDLSRSADQRTAPYRVVSRERAMINGRVGTRYPQYKLREVGDREFFGIAEINRAWFG